MAVQSEARIFFALIWNQRMEGIPVWKVVESFKSVNSSLSTSITQQLHTPPFNFFYRTKSTEKRHLYFRVAEPTSVLSFVRAKLHYGMH